MIIQSVQQKSSFGAWVAAVVRGSGRQSWGLIEKWNLAREMQETEIPQKAC